MKKIKKAYSKPYPPVGLSLPSPEFLKKFHQRLSEDAMIRNIVPSKSGAIVEMIEKWVDGKIEISYDEYVAEKSSNHPYINLIFPNSELLSRFEKKVKEMSKKYKVPAYKNYVVVRLIRKWMDGEITLSYGKLKSKLSS